MKNDPDSGQFLKLIKWAVLLLVVLLLVQAGVSILNSLDVIGGQSENGDEAVSPDDTLQKAEAAANSAENTANNLQTLLSFIESAAVLIGLALGAAAYVGFRNSNDTRKELRDETQLLQTSRLQFQEQIREQFDSMRKLHIDIETRQDEFEAEINGALDVERHAANTLEAYVRQYEDALTQLPSRLEESKRLQQTYSDLLIASQELRLNNHLEAYAAAMRVLEYDSDNAPALYIAGWLELQYIADQRQGGIEKLKRIITVQRDWPTARAAYGVGLRRQARATTDQLERRRLFLEAEAELLTALTQSPHLLDLNLESFWGPVGGIRREMEQYPGAIEAYLEALKVTPTSSYPQGNLAGLLLSQAKTPEESEQVLAAFEKTLQYATIELAVNPGDYYHVMDVAMARMILGHKDAGNFVTAFEMLDAALNMHVNREPLNTSLSAGWKFLYQSCPTAWVEVRHNLEEAIQKVEAALKEKDVSS